MKFWAFACFFSDEKRPKFYEKNVYIRNQHKTYTEILAEMIDFDWLKFQSIKIRLGRGNFKKRENESKFVKYET